MENNFNKIILDLCGGTGSWSKPYQEAGYDVRVITIPEHDVLTYEPPKNVYGILAAPPCTMFSLARTTAKTPRDFKQGMQIVEACLRIIWQCRIAGGGALLGFRKSSGVFKAIFGQTTANFPAMRLWRLSHEKDGFVGVLQHA